MYYIYFTYKKNEPSKCYVGMTKRTIDSGYKGSGVYLLNAIKKYGTIDFIRIDIGEFSDINEAHFWEGFYIKLYKTEAKYGGYNISPKGGLGCPGDIVSEETKTKIGKSRKGKFHSKEARNKISIANKGKLGSMKGKHHKEETKQKMKYSQKGRLSPMKGRHHLQSSKDKISIAMKERDKSINIRISNSLKGIKRPPRTEEQRQHYRDAALRRIYG